LHQLVALPPTALAHSTIRAVVDPALGAYVRNRTFPGAVSRP